MPYSIRLQIHFYHPSDEVSILLEPVFPAHPDLFCELLLFSSLTLRQFCNLSWNPLSKNIAYNLMWITEDKESMTLTPEKLLDNRLEGEPRLVPFRGIPASTQVTAFLDVGEQKGQFKLDSKGYRLLFDHNTNIDYCLSPLLLLRHLAETHRADEDYLLLLCHVANELAHTFLMGKVNSPNHLTTAFKIAKDNYSSHEWMKSIRTSPPRPV